MSESPDLLLVTGGSGYVGGWALAELLRRGHRVRATLRDPARADRLRSAVAEETGSADALSFATADLSRNDGWDVAMDGVSHVLHIATPMASSGGSDVDPERAIVRPAVDGTRRVLDAAAAHGVRRVVMTSAANAASPSSHATEGVFDETLWTDPEDPSIIPTDGPRPSPSARRGSWPPGRGLPSWSLCCRVPSSGPCCCPPPRVRSGSSPAC